MARSPWPIEHDDPHVQEKILNELRTLRQIAVLWNVFFLAFVAIGLALLVDAA